MNARPRAVTVRPCPHRCSFREFASLPEHDRTADSFAALAPIGGMTVVGPPLAVSHPLPAPVAA
jgi:hypothetical protein